MMVLLSSMFEPLWEDGEFILSRGVRDGDLSPILVETPALEQPAPGSLQRLEHAYGLRDELDPAWAVQPLELVWNQGRPTLLLADPGGEPLARLVGRPWEVRPFLRIAISLAGALRQLHARGLIHKDIKPAHILVSLETGEVWLTGFGIASRLPRERQAPAPPEVIAGTLAYMAPEQTGRMNRSIDSRSDLYAYGVMLYELLTGTLPFTATEPMEWIHCHIARLPIPPGDRAKGIPGPVAAIVMKLLAKTAEERYQTAAGIEADLRRCLAEWESLGRIEPFPLGMQDVPAQLLIPEKLYGREREIDTLLAAFDRVVASGRPELVLVSGYSGIGKSSVVNELHKALVPPRGLFASGKFDQYKRDIPYATLAQAFQSLVRPLLSKIEAELCIRRDALHEALGPNGRLIVDLVPELKHIIGEQPPVPELPPQDAQRRFQLVFRRFIGVFARPEHPLALFLDDLQWLDAATLELIEDLLIQSDVPHLMLIGAYRDNEVNSSHPLMRKLEVIRKAGATVQEIILVPLQREDVEQLIAESLRSAPERAASLASLVHEKTAGNPFFAIQFLSSLAEEGLLDFDHRAARWSWDLTRIRAKGYTDNVVDLMIGKLNRLPVETQNALQEFACLGNSAEITTLSILHGTSEEKVHSDLWEALRLEFIVRLEGSYKFAHDRVQEAAYALIPERVRTEAHLRVGRLLLAHTPPEKREETIFDIIHQINRGAALITSRDEREQLAELNLVAAKRAKASAAYASALQYLVAGKTLLANDSWERRHDLTFALELHRAECEFLTSALAEADQRLVELSNRAETTVERAAVTCLQTDVYTTLGQTDRAVAVCLDYLRYADIDWTPHPTEEETRREYEYIWNTLGNRTIEALIDLPLMDDPSSLATMDVLTKLLPPAAYTDASLGCMTSCRAVSLSLERGNCDASCFAYSNFSRMTRPRFGDYEAGYHIGELGYALVETRGLTRFEASTYLCFGLFVLPWTKHVRVCRDLLQRALEIANRNGDLMWASYTSCELNSCRLFASDPLPELQREAERGFTIAEKAGFGLCKDGTTTVLALSWTLRGLTPTFGHFDDTQHDELQFEHHISSQPHLALVACRHWVRKLQARYLAGDYAAAMDALSRAQQLLWTSTSFFEEAEYHFYGALLRGALCDSVEADRDGRTSTRPAEPAQHVEALATHYRQLRIWAEHCPENFENRAALVGAEIARIEGRDLDAMRLYEQAIGLARANSFVQNEALANEIAARFYAVRGFEKIAHAYLRDARYCYLRWGADGKVRQLEQLYPQLREEEPLPGSTSTVGAPVAQLDLATVIKVSQEVSGEIVLDKLLDALMGLAVEHAGAERGLLLLLHGDGLRIEAEAFTDHDTLTVRLGESAVTAAALPESVLHYVVRTQESVILDDASAPNQFSTDEYICQTHARSILCLPLVKQARLIGVLYLENHLTSHVFTPARIAVLQLLASQAAISLENALLYTEIQEAEGKVRQQERELRQLIDFVPQSMFAALEPNGSFLYANQVVLEYCGLSAEELQTRAKDVIARVFHPDDVERFLDQLRRGWERKTLWETEARILRKDGQYRWFLIRYNPLRDDQGHITRWYLTATDIEDRKQAEERFRNENVALREEIDTAFMFEEIVGASPALQAVLARVAKVAPTDSTVLITGETGTGKELIARAIHKRSLRAARAFVSVNCAAIPPSLIASELFGHEKGAFTGALQRRLGRFELAESGTLFLDEIGELPAETQIALLRVLQEREFERVGGSRAIAVDVRVIAATNRDLEAAIAAGTFRSDLFYRLNVFPLEMPALRDRKDDIPLLVAYFIDRYVRKAGKKIRGINTKTLELLQAYSWPGNIRELQNVIERSVIVCETETFSVDASWLARESVPTPRAPQPLADTVVAQEKVLIEAALAATRGRVAGPSGAAATLGMPSTTLESKIKSLKIDKYRFKTARHFKTD